MERRTITIDGIETSVYDLSEQQKHLLAHIDNLSLKINEATSMLEQFQAARESFSVKLIASRSQSRLTDQQN